jgi:hypothetical protein
MEYSSKYIEEANPSIDGDVGSEVYLVDRSRLPRFCSLRQFLIVFSLKGGRRSDTKNTRSTKIISGITQVCFKSEEKNEKNNGLSAAYIDAGI